MQLPVFKNPMLLKQALTHRSAVNEGQGKTNNERLEFLGDAVLELLVSEFLYRGYPRKSEGELTKARTALVRTETLANLAKNLNIPERLVISKGERKEGGHYNPSLLADTFEAIIGALYLDQGLERVRSFLSDVLLADAERTIEQAAALDAKSLLQEQVQARGHPSPVYRIVKKEGPDHQRLFTAQVFVSGRPFGTGEGKSKQEAEQKAARSSLSMV